MEELPKHEVMQRWWSFMGDIMTIQEDGAPIVKPLELMFHMPWRAPTYIQPGLVLTFIDWIGTAWHFVKSAF